MWQGLKLRLYRRRIERALARIGRGDVRCDRLQLNRISHRLEVQWRARDIHPWDRSLAPGRKAALLVEQTLDDTEAAICKLFEALPQVDVIELTVLGPSSETVLMAGTVHRSVLTARRGLLSVRMRLRELGVFPIQSNQA